MKVALITGAKGGIGTALCRSFARAGYRVIAMDILSESNDKEDSLSFDLEILCHDEEYRHNVMTKIKNLVGNDDLVVLVNNAAVQILNSVENVTTKELYKTIDVNLIAPFILTQGLLPELEKARGSVINISSIHERLTKPAFVTYATSKAALSGMTRVMAVDLGARVRINAICPAATRTPMLMAGFEGKEDKFKELSGMHPLGRIAETDEIAEVAVFLASEQASFITGAIMSVDGGISNKLNDPA